MKTVKRTPFTIPPATTLPIALHLDRELTETDVAITIGSAGTLSFRNKPLDGQYETPEAPNSIDLSIRKWIGFSGASLEAIEIANPGAQTITGIITQRE